MRRTVVTILQESQVWREQMEISKCWACRAGASSPGRTGLGVRETQERRQMMRDEAGEEGE